MVIPERWLERCRAALGCLGGGAYLQPFAETPVEQGQEGGTGAGAGAGSCRNTLGSRVAMGQKSRSAQLAELQAVDDRLKAQGDPRAKRRLERQARAEQPSEPKRQRVRCDWRQELRDDYLDARSTACQHCLTCDAEVRGPQAPVSLPGCRSCTTSSRATATTSRQARCERHGGGRVSALWRWRTTTRARRARRGRTGRRCAGLWWPCASRATDTWRRSRGRRGASRCPSG